MSKYINLNGNTWDGNSISSKIRHDDKYGAFITLGWLYDAPSIDLAEHDKQIRTDAIDELLKAITDNSYKIEEDYTVGEFVRVCIWEDDLQKIAEQLKENRYERRING